MNCSKRIELQAAVAIATMNQETADYELEFASVETWNLKRQQFQLATAELFRATSAFDEHVAVHGCRKADFH